jgi:predicted negative regulator of RcsB-dependent stress response
VPFAIVGVLGVAGWWLIPLALQFLARDLAEQDQLASVVSMVIGLASLSVSVVGLVRNRAPDLPSPRFVMDRPGRLPRIDEVGVSALALRVHPASDPLGSPARSRRRRSEPDPALPTFVRRAQGRELSAWMRKARVDGGFVLLVGNSCVGKSRLLYETARSELPGYAVLAPELGDGARVERFAAGPVPSPGLIVWLDELQRFLPGPYLAEGSTPVTAAALRQLIDGPVPVVVVGTLWPRYFAALQAPAKEPGGEFVPRYPAAMDVIDGLHPAVIRLESFLPTERSAAADLAWADERLATALADPDYNVTEALAGARTIVDRYERGTDEQRTILHAVADTRRLGVQGLLTEHLLHAAAAGYLTRSGSDDTWFPRALGELVRDDRPEDRATAPLILVSGEPPGCTMTDYLLQRLVAARDGEPVPDAVWAGLVAHVTADEDLERLAEAALDRMRYDDARALYRKLAGKGNRRAAEELADLDAAPEHVAELWSAAASGRRSSVDRRSPAGRLRRILTRAGRIDDLLRLADLPGDPAGANLDAALLLAGLGRLNELRARVGANHDRAGGSLAQLLAGRGDIEGALEVHRGRVAAGAWGAASDYVALSVDSRRAEEAIGFLRDWLLTPRGESHHSATEPSGYDPPDDAENAVTTFGPNSSQLESRRSRQDLYNRESAAEAVAELLIGQGRSGEAAELWRLLETTDAFNARRKRITVLARAGRVEDLRNAALLGDSKAADAVADTLAGRGRVRDAVAFRRAMAASGHHGAAEALIDLLAGLGRTDELRRLLTAQIPVPPYHRPPDHLWRRHHLGETTPDEDRKLVAALVKDRNLSDLSSVAWRNKDALKALAKLVKRRSRNACVLRDWDRWRCEKAYTRLLAGQGRLGQAIAWWRVRARHDPHAAGELTRLLVGTGRTDEAIRILQTRAGRDATAAQELAGLLICLGRDELAVDTWSSRRDALSDDTRALADLATGLGRPATAVAFSVPEHDGDQFWSFRAPDPLFDRADDERIEYDGQKRTVHYAAAELARYGLIDAATDLLGVPMSPAADQYRRQPIRLFSEVFADLGRVDEAVWFRADPGARYSLPSSPTWLMVLLAGLGRVEDIPTATPSARSLWDVTADELSGGTTARKRYDATAYCRLGCADEAVELTRRRHPNNSDNLPELLASLGRVKELQKLTSVAAGMALMNLHLDCGRADDAITVWRDRLAKSDDDRIFREYDDLRSTADKFVQLGTVDHALELLRHYSARGWHSSRSVLLDLLLGLGHVGEAVEVWRTAARDGLSGWQAPLIIGLGHADVVEAEVARGTYGVAHHLAGVRAAGAA